MRDPNRIDHVLEVLARYWKANPDARLSQIIANATAAGTRSRVDPYYVEDDTVVTGIEIMEKVHQMTARPS